MGGWGVRGLLAIAAAAVPLASCSQTRGAPPATCTAGPDAIVRALAVAPARVLLAGATPLSECVRRARADADLQNVGAVFTSVADELRVRARADPGAALRLGYLVGASERGGQHSNGIQAELIRRLEQDAALPGAGPSAVSALRRGLLAGRRRG